MDELLVFDGDDTLWATEGLYDSARQRARRAVEDHGLDGARWETIERARDVENVVGLGLTAARFPTSCVQALEEVSPSGADGVPAALRMSVWQAAMSVFSTPAPPVPGAREVLSELAEHTIVLLTKGDQEVQRRRLASSGLAPFIDHVEIVAEKLPSTFRLLAHRCGRVASTAVSIGNSLASDICPAVEAGMHGIWIDAHVWEYERSRSDRVVVPEGVVVAESIHEVPKALQELRTCP